MKEIKFDFDDILLEPSKISKINSRKEVNPLVKDGYLPLFTAPMDTVVSEDNYELFQSAGINVVLPRGEKGNDECFISYSLMDIKSMVEGLHPTGKYLIDVANGHMEDLVAVTKEIKQVHPNLTLMVGNIANPLTYKLLSEAGADYIRVGIGNGGGCLTTQQTAIGYPMASLIQDCYTASIDLDNPAYIVADGGMQKFSDVIKALALGADFVMLGSLLNKTIESAGSTYLMKHIKIPQKFAQYLYGKKVLGRKINIYKKFRGMSTKEVQKKWNRPVLKTSEGVVRVRKVEYTLDGWVNNLTDYLKSSMSYCNSRTLGEFIGYAKFNFITESAQKRFRK
jgi:GMP reductase